MSKPRKMPTQARIQKWDTRVMKLWTQLMQAYAAVPNKVVFPSYGWGTSVDILVTDGTNKILKLREVTNFDRFTRNGKQIYINNTRDRSIARAFLKSMDYEMKCYRTIS